jgi:hypothetical protein
LPSGQELSHLGYRMRAPGTRRTIPSNPAWKASAPVALGYRMRQPSPRNRYQAPGPRHTWNVSSGIECGGRLAESIPSCEAGVAHGIPSACMRVLVSGGPAPARWRIGSSAHRTSGRAGRGGARGRRRRLLRQQQARRSSGASKRSSGATCRCMPSTSPTRTRPSGSSPTDAVRRGHPLRRAQGGRRERRAMPLEYYENNLESTFSLLRAMRRHGCGLLVFSSSATVYGDRAPLPYREDYEPLASRATLRATEGDDRAGAARRRRHRRGVRAACG